jgi:RNA polymerase sigma-70 factor (ECF subfamily)
VTPLSLLQRARANEGDAWSRIVALYCPLVRLWCRSAGLGPEDADDVSQDVFASASSHLAGFHHDRPGDTFRGWLRVITRNAIRAHLRRSAGGAHAEGGSAAWQRLENVADPLATSPADEEEEVNGLYRRAVEQVRGEFEPATWQVFWLTVVEGRSPLALAAEVGVTPAAIRQAKSRVLRRLRTEMGELIE